MKITPLGERVLIKPVKEEQEEKTKGGIFIPESAKENNKKAEVVAVGKKSDGKELPVEKGDTVLYGGYSSDEFEVEGEKYIILDFKDILAKIE
ncbi:MAG: co-chaperone GroES [Nanobdellota archaeon]